MQQSQHPRGWCVSPHFTLSFLQDTSAASQDSGLRATVSSAESPYSKFLEDLLIISVNFLFESVFTVMRRYSQHLKQTEVKLIADRVCKKQSYYGDLITDNMFCAGSPDWSTDACKVRQGHNILYVLVYVCVCVRALRAKVMLRTAAVHE